MLIDVGFLIFLMYGFYLGYSRGILKTLFAVLSIVIAVLVTMKFSPILMELIEETFKISPSISMIVGFALSFLLVMLLVRLFGKGVEKLFKVVKLNFINKIVGGALMAMIFVISYSFCIWFLSRSDLINNTAQEKSITYEQIIVVPDMTQDALAQLKPAFKGFWEKSKEAFETSNNDSGESSTPSEE